MSAAEVAKKTARTEKKILAKESLIAFEPLFPAEAEAKLAEALTWSASPDTAF